MECVRESGEEKNNIMWVSDNMKTVSATDVNDCRQQCLSDVRCKMWQYGAPSVSAPSVSTPSVCQISYVSPTSIQQVNGMTMGVIKCEKSYNVTSIILWILILIAVISLGIFLFWRKKSS